MEIVHALSAQLTWTHFREIIYLDDSLQRDYYAEMCRIERWNTRTLKSKIQGMLFERTAISKKPEELVKQEIAALRQEDKLTPDLVFRDPYFLDFLGLKDTYSEKDLETAILREMESFILELGAGFSFVARQKRITVDNEDYYLDLLFFHRKLNTTPAIKYPKAVIPAPYLVRDKLQPEFRKIRRMPPYQVRGRLIKSGMTKSGYYFTGLIKKPITDYFERFQMLCEKLANNCIG